MTTSFISGTPPRLAPCHCAIPYLIPARWLLLEQVIAACIDQTFTSTDKDEKVRLSAVESRARLLRERKEGQN